MKYDADLHAEIVRALQKYTESDPLDVLRFLVEYFDQGIVFSTSFGIEDQLITHLIFENNLPVRVFTLDTGRNFQETYQTWNDTLARYQKTIEVYSPKDSAVAALLNSKGPNSFYTSVENRQECCRIRKVEPLGRALHGQSLWITGIRADQSSNRKDMNWLEWDDAHGLFKFHPLFHWKFDQVRAFIDAHQIPYNVLHDQGFVSIGCAPCTRAIQPGEDFRAGRWWWEASSKKECGLHFHAPSTTSQS